MSPSERERNLDRIRHNVNVKCILMSIKAGGVGQF